MIFVFVPARNIDEAIPALLSFLPNFSKDTEKKLFLYLTVNNLENNDHNQILDLYPQYQKEVVWNPYTLKNCNKSFPLFFLKTMQKFRKFLTGNFPDYEENRIILTNSDIYIQDPTKLIEYPFEDLPVVPDILPKYDEFPGEWEKDNPKFWEAYGLTIKGGCLEFMEGNLEKADSLGVSAATGIIQSVSASHYLGNPIKKLNDVVAFMTRKQVMVSNASTNDSLCNSLSELIKTWK